MKLTQRVEEDYRKAAAAPPGTVSAPASIKGRAGGSATKKAAAKGAMGGKMVEKGDSGMHAVCMPLVWQLMPGA